MDDQKLEAMLASTGQWVALAEWSSERNEFDAGGWLDAWGARIGSGTASLPNGGYVDLRPFCAIRGGAVA